MIAQGRIEEVEDLVAEVPPLWWKARAGLYLLIADVTV